MANHIYKTIFLIKVDMVKICEHLLNLKIQKIANYFSKCELQCTGNKTHFNAFLDVCLSCGQTRCINFENNECSYQHSYGTKHPLVFREKEKIVYCFSCQQNLTQQIRGNQEKENSNGKLEKVIQAHQRVIDLSVKLAERVETFSINPPQKKVQKPKAQKKQLQKPSKQQKQKQQIENKGVKQQTQSSIFHLQEHNSSKLNVFGLSNLGNTCFFNSTLQCIYATQIYHSLYPSFQLDTDQEFGKVGEVTLLFRKFLANKEKHITPKGLFGWVCKSKGVYKQMDQQDAQQLLGVLLNGFIDGEKFWLKLGKTPLGQKITLTEKIFGFFLASRLECLECNKVSWSLDFSLEVAVPLARQCKKVLLPPLPQGPVPFEEIKIENLHYPQPIESGSILDSFFAAEYLGKENYFTCEKCESQKAVRKFYIKDAPQVLIITIKRFNNNLSKNNTQVKIVQSINIDGYCLNPSKSSYNLYSMIVHNGTARGGHYTACSKRGDRWYYFSDSSVKQISWQKVRTSQPYILFYRRVSN